MTRYSLPYSQARQLRSLHYTLAFSALVNAIALPALVWQVRFDVVAMVLILVGGMCLGIRFAQSRDEAAKRDEPELVGPERWRANCVLWQSAESDMERERR